MTSDADATTFSEASQTAASVQNPVGEEGDDEDDEEYHDSGDYFDNAASSMPEDGSKLKAAGGHTGTKSNHSYTTQSKSSPASLDMVGNKLQEVAVKFFEAISKLENIRAPLHQQRDEVAALLPLDHLG